MPEECSLGGDDGTTVPPAPASPLGTPNPAPGAAVTAAPIEIPTVSIIDTILQLDGYLSGDVRRAEKTARFCSKPWLEADIDELEFELQGLTDEQGNPLPRGEVALGEQVRTAEQVALEIQTLQAEMGAAFVSVRMAQLPSDKWQEFLTRTKDVRDKARAEGSQFPNSFWDEVIEFSAKTPAITAEQVAQLRTKLGDPQMDTLASVAWAVNAESGVSIPKSPLSSHVLRRAARSKS